jgi:putative flippase GtrA
MVRRREQILYLIVGGWNTLFGYSLFAGLYYLLHDVVGMPRVGGSMLALAMASVIGMINNYILYKIIVFRSHGSVRRELPRFLVVYVVALTVNLAVLPVALHELPFNVYAVQAGFTILIVVATYAANKYFSFASRGTKDGGTPNESTGVGR